MERYDIQLTPKRHINWCNNNWYETADTPCFFFTEDEVRDILTLMAKHYQYKMDIVSENGTIYHYNHFDHVVWSPSVVVKVSVKTPEVKAVETKVDKEPQPKKGLLSFLKFKKK